MSSTPTKKARNKKPVIGCPEHFIAAPPGLSAASGVERPLPTGTHPLRAWHIRNNDRKWVNGTTLHYAFFRSGRDGRQRSWNGAGAQMAVVRKAFQSWKDAGIGLEFCEVKSREDAEFRIGFLEHDGCWSYVGRDAIDVANDANERTMNFDIDLTTPDGWREAIFQIGAALGFRGLDGMQAGPAVPEGGLPEVLVALAQNDYPPLAMAAEKELIPGQSLALSPGEQMNFRIRPLLTRPYTIRLFGQCDAVIVLFEDLGGPGFYNEMDGETEFLAGCDNSGTDRDAVLRARLHRDREYILRIRVYFRKTSQEAAVLLW